MLLTPPTLLFAGKGGVGKTTLATALALRSAARGLRTLLVSTDPAHSTADVLGVPLGAEPTEVASSLFATEIDPDAEAARYVAAVRDRLTDITPPGMRPEVDRQLELARQTPGVAEAALLERLAGFVEGVGTRWDRVVVDTAPFGHTLRLLALPNTMRSWLESVMGRRRQLGALERVWHAVRGAGPDTDGLLDTLDQRQQMLARLGATLSDPARCAVVLVAIPERLSVLETTRSAAALRAAGIVPAGLFVNRVTPPEAEGAWAEARRGQEQEYLAAFEAAFPGLARIIVPQLALDVRDRAALRYIGARLEGSS